MTINNIISRSFPMGNNKTKIHSYFWDMTSELIHLQERNNDSSSRQKYQSHANWKGSFEIELSEICLWYWLINCQHTKKYIFQPVCLAYYNIRLCQSCTIIKANIEKLSKIERAIKRSILGGPIYGTQMRWGNSLSIIAGLN